MSYYQRRKTCIKFITKIQFCVNKNARGHGKHKHWHHQWTHRPGLVPAAGQTIHRHGKTKKPKAGKQSLSANSIAFLASLLHSAFLGRKGGRAWWPGTQGYLLIRTWAFQLPLWSANGFYYYLHTCCSRGIVLNKNSNFHTCSRCAPCSFVLVRVRSCSAGAASANWQSGKTDVTTSASRTFPFPLPLPAESPFAHRLSRPLSFTPAQAFRLEFAAVRVQVRVGSGWSLNWMPSLGQGIWFLLLFIGAPQDNATERARGAKANQDSWQMWPYQQQIVIDSFRLVNDANFQRPEIS